MKARILLLAAAISLTAMIAFPAASAQVPAQKVWAEVKWAMDHEMVLPETGRGDMEMEIFVWGEDFSCPAPMGYYVTFTVVSGIQKWAGASIVPNAPYGPFVFDKPNPDGKVPATYKGNQPKPVFNMVWDVEGAPKVGARTEYVVKPDLKASDKSGETGPCVPTPNTGQSQNSSPMVVSLPDRPENDPNATAGFGESCEDNPFQAKCNTGVAQEGGDSPGPSIFLILLGLSGLVALRRRNK